MAWQQASVRAAVVGASASRWVWWRWCAVWLLIAIAASAPAWAGTAASAPGWVLPAALSPSAALPSSAASCNPVLQASTMAWEVQPGQRPARGWQPVPIPHQLAPGTQAPDAAAWYRLDWLVPCADMHLALAISGIRVAGTVYWDDALLWSDASLQEPFSRSWNTPRWWPLATSVTGAGLHRVWVRVVSPPQLRVGLGHVELGPQGQIAQDYDYRQWRQRTVYIAMAGLALAIGLVALVVWLWRRTERIYLWMGLMQLAWAWYLSVILSQRTWPGLSSVGMSSMSLIAYLLFMQCFCMFTLRFGGQRLVRLEALLWSVSALWVGAVLLHDYGLVPDAAMVTLAWGGFIGNASCWYFVYRALRIRQPRYLLLGAAWLVMGVVGLHDLPVAMRLWHNHETWMGFTGPLILLVLAVLLGWEVAQHMRRIDRFNVELQSHVEAARAELAQVLAQQHQQALEHAKLQERVQIAHDLHDGLGSSLVRSMALVEQSAQPLGNARVLSLLKVLRDDLRQLIDSGSSSGAAVPETPAQWLAPLRHRFVRILDALGWQAHWQVDAQWQQPPTALQCMAMARFLEEAFANVLKHSQAQCIRVRCTQQGGQWWVAIKDDGVGFDVAAAQAAGHGVGLRSMQVRVAKVGGQLRITSGPHGTELCAAVPLLPAQGDAALAAKAPAAGHCVDAPPSAHTAVRDPFVV